MASPTASGSWQSAFGTVAPVGHVLRRAYPDRWVRIHSLPAGKRYALSPLESQALIARHNKVATTVLGSGSKCVLFVPYYESAQQHNQKDWARSLALSPVTGKKLRDPGDPDMHFRFLASEVEWTPSAFDLLLDAVANESAPSVTFFSIVRGSVYAPYDGGADLIAASMGEAAKYRTRWKKWQSSRLDGL